ncbi:MAG: hypothetical protein RE471_02995 [Ferroplasma sp.]|uniref:hypothetical protein n=1 Tax=Ferroplasma sp. TaxID=2591003 RepID=UPI0028161D9B|nr:hypothetical protein [Ferroplasma sp.]WMT51854.1 MAG: hypothetical protein RE471_02995 [Ferroplasma sp.]
MRMINFSILSTILSIFVSALAQFLSIIEGNITYLMNYTAYQIYFLEYSWASSFHGIWGPVIFFASSGAAMIGIYAIFDLTSGAHVVEESL